MKRAFIFAVVVLSGCTINGTPEVYTPATRVIEEKVERAECSSGH